MNPLAGLPLDYLIGGNGPYVGSDARITECSYRAGPARRGISIGYCNLFDEENRGNYGPYRHESDTAEQYNEGEIVPGTDGWRGNLTEQFERRNKEGFSYIELDNPDAYSIEDVLGAIDLAESHSLKVISKNPLLLDGDPTPYVARCYGVIVERGAGNPIDMAGLRKRAGKPELPVWFVSFGAGRNWAGNIAAQANQFRNMGVTYSSAGEYGSSTDILLPTP